MRPLRVANFSGFLGDRLSAAREMVEGGEIDVLSGDFLAELTLFLLWRAREKDPSLGYATPFLRQMEDVLGPCVERRIRVVASAGGLHPAALAARLRELAQRLGIAVRVAHVEGDDLMPRLVALQAAGQSFAHMDTGVPLASAPGRAVTANAYLGGWGIAEALGAGADVVVCGRVADASLVVGPAAWHHGWARDAWDRLAGATIAGHLIECGAQVSGGNYAFFGEVPGLRHPGFPIAEVSEDGSCVITKHPGTGGEVSLGTVTAQLLYEIDGPRYLTPDVVARFDTVRIAEAGKDRVRVSGARGEPPPATAKVAVNVMAGYRNAMTFVLTGLSLEAKARVVTEALQPVLERCQAAEVRLVRSNREQAATSEEAGALLRVMVKDADARKVGRAFSGAAVELALSSYPGLYVTTPPEDAREFAVFWPCLVPAAILEHAVVWEDGTRTPVPLFVAPAPGSPPESGLEPAASTLPSGPTRTAPFGALFGARSGDKGGNANVGVWARSEAGYAWLAAWLTTARFQQLVPETATLDVRRYAFPNLRAVNFVIVGLLDGGALASTRSDPQAKALGEFLRSRLVELPVALLEG
jgi:hypothetical protein